MINSTICTLLIPLTSEELKEINGGIFPVILAAAQAYMLICGLATIVGAATAYIENHHK